LELDGVFELWIGIDPAFRASVGWAKLRMELVLIYISPHHDKRHERLLHALPLLLLLLL